MHCLDYLPETAISATSSSAPTCAPKPGRRPPPAIAPRGRPSPPPLVTTRRRPQRGSLTGPRSRQEFHLPWLPLLPVRREEARSQHGFGPVARRLVVTSAPHASDSTIAALSR